MCIVRALLFVSLTAAGLSISAASQAPSLRPGQYEVTTALALPGTSMKPQPRKDVNCLAAEDLKDLSRTFGKKHEQGCTVSDYHVTATGVTFTKTCPSG